MAKKTDPPRRRRTLLTRVGAIALLAVAVVGAIYLREETRSQSGGASEDARALAEAGFSPAETFPAVPELAPAGEVAEETSLPEAPAPNGTGQDQKATEPHSERPAVKLEERVASPPSAKALPKLVDLGADKCIPCKRMAPILEELRVEYAGVFEVVFIDVWKNPAEADRYGIRIIPTQIFYDSTGKELFRHVGFYSKEEILAKWRQLGLDLGRR